MSQPAASSVRVYLLQDDYARKRGFLGQHGFAALVEAEGPGGTSRVLVDTGQEASTVLANAERLGVDLGRVDAILITHGHYDHNGGLLGILDQVGAEGKLVLMHPDALKPKFAIKPRFRFVGTPGLTAGALEGRGAVLLLSREPVELAPFLRTTGEVPRQTPFEHVEGFLTLGPDGVGLVEDKLLDDQALVVRHRDGLVVITGCAHSGVVNTLLHAHELMGEERILAVLGGFHLEGASDERLRATVRELQRLEPERVYACHCTGLKAFCQLMAAFGPRFRRLGSGDVVEL